MPTAVTDDPWAHTRAIMRIDIPNLNVGTPPPDYRCPHGDYLPRTQPLAHITAALHTRGPRHVALTYLGPDAPDLLPLHAGDLLIVNAARPALRAHATSPTALAHFVRREVLVLSAPNLHANVLTTTRHAIVGSASASHSSTLADEAVLITDDPHTISAARTFIEALDPTTVVDDAFLDNAAAIWALGRAVPLPGITSRRRAASEFLPTPLGRMFLWHTTDHQSDPNETLAWETHARLTAPGPTTDYPTEWLRIDHPGDGGRARLARGDILLQVTADNTTIAPPAVVDSDPIPVPHSVHAVAYLLRTRADLTPLPVADAEAQLADLGHPNPRLRTDHQVISPELRAALLQLWRL